MSEMTLWYRPTQGAEWLEIAKAKDFGVLRAVARKDAEKHNRDLKKYSWTNPVNHYILFLNQP